MKLLLYCTKSKPYLYQGCAKPMHTTDRNNPFNYKWGFLKYKTQNCLNGKIVGECDFEVEETESFIGDKEYIDFEYGYYKYGYRTYKEDFDDLMKHSNLTAEQLDNYLKSKNGYAIHIKNLKIYDEPKKLSEVYSIHNVGGMLLTDKLKKAPQNMQRISVKEWEYGTYNPNDIAILISIHPQWLCKILNGEKTIEIRKKVLKGMLNNE